MDDDRSAQSALAGLRIVAFESRRAAEIEQMLTRHGATVISAPALREVPIEENAAALEFVRRLEQGSLDAVILLTGVGTRALVEAVQARCPTQRLGTLLRALPILPRRPKPVPPLRALRLAATGPLP